LGAEPGGDRYGGEQVGRGRADPRRRRGDFAFGLANIGATPQQIERQPRPHIVGNARNSSAPPPLGSNLFRIGAAQNGHAASGVENGGRQVRWPGLQDGQLTQAAIKPRLHDVERLLRGRDIVAGEFQTRLKPANVDVVANHIGDDRYQYRMAHLGQCLPIVTRRFQKAPVLAETRCLRLACLRPWQLPPIELKANAGAKSRLLFR